MFLLLLFASSNCFYSSDATAYVTFSRPCMLQQAQTYDSSRKKVYSMALREKKNNQIEKIVNKVSDIVTAPMDIPFQIYGSSNAILPLGYLLILGLLNILILPLVTSAVLDILFIAYFVFGRSTLIDYEIIGDDENSADIAVTDLISLAGSFITAGLVSTQGFYRPDPGSGVIQLVALCCCMFLFVSLCLKAIPGANLRRDEEIPNDVLLDDESPSKELLRLWDEKFGKD